MKIRSAQDYSSIAKKLQVGAIFIGIFMVLLGATRLFGHTEIHGDVIYEIELEHRTRVEREEMLQYGIEIENCSFESAEPQGCEAYKSD